MESKLMPCKCGGTVLPFAVTKANESDYRLVGVKCMVCGKYEAVSIKKMSGADAYNDAVMQSFKKWNERRSADDHK